MIGRISVSTANLAIKHGIDIENIGSLRPDGRVIIFMRSFPGSHKSGYVLRSRLVWWIHHGQVISGDAIHIHHINGDESDDRIENLKKMTRSEHLHHHNAPLRKDVIRWCKWCNKKFSIKAWRLKDKTRGQYCSQECWHQKPRTAEMKENQSIGIKKAYAEGRR